MLVSLDDKTEKLPLVPLRDVVVFPYMTLPLLVGRLPSINAIEKAVARDRMLFVTAQRRSEALGPNRQRHIGSRQVTLPEPVVVHHRRA